MHHHGCEIIVIARRQCYLESQSDGPDAAVGIAFGAAARQIEKHRGLLGIPTFQSLRIRQELPCVGLRCSGQRPAEKLAPGHGADAQGFTGRQTAHYLRFLRTAWHQRINQKIGVEMNHRKDS